MAKTNAISVQDSIEHTQEPDKSSKTPTAPAAPDIGGKLEDDTPPWETPAPDKQPSTQKESGSKPPKDKPSQKPEADKPQKAKRTPRLPKGLKEEKQAVGIGGGKSGQSNKQEDTTLAPATAEPLAPQKDATRPGEMETIVYVAHAELFPFKNHPFQLRDDEAMKSLVASVKERGVDQPAIVRPREDGGFEIVAGHRRQHASELAGFANVPCVVRNMTDDEAVLTMTEKAATHNNQ